MEHLKTERSNLVESVCRASFKSVHGERSFLRGEIMRSREVAWQNARIDCAANRPGTKGLAPRGVTLGCWSLATAFTDRTCRGKNGVCRDELGRLLGARRVAKEGKKAASSASANPMKSSDVNCVLLADPPKTSSQHLQL
jgi:hypothetical protein